VIGQTSPLRSKGREPVRAFITLGSNVEPERYLPEAVRRLADTPGLRLLAVSQVYESAAIDAQGRANPDQPPFLNAAILVETSLSILRLQRDVLRPLEEALDRVRTADKFAPRTLDLDVVLYGSEVLGLTIEYEDGSSELILPDPDVTQHAHVALPLADLDPDFVHPVTGETLGEIADRFRDSPGIRLHSLVLPAGND